MGERADPQPTHVVTCFLLRRAGESESGRDEVLLAQRSERVRTYRGAWGAISGYLEPGVSPLDQAYTEIREETGLAREQATLLRAGEPLPVRDTEQGLDWVVHPFLFALAPGAEPRIDWEATTFRWATPDALVGLPTVPKLPEALASVYPPAAGE